VHQVAAPQAVGQSDTLTLGNNYFLYHTFQWSITWLTEITIGVIAGHSLLDKLARNNVCRRSLLENQELLRSTCDHFLAIAVPLQELTIVVFTHQVELAASW
jgi:hypothetical protein